VQQPETRVILQGRVREHTMTTAGWDGTCGVLLLSISNFLAQKRVDFVTRRGVSISHPRRHCFSFISPTNCSTSNFSCYFSLPSVAYSKFLIMASRPEMREEDESGFCKFFRSLPQKNEDTVRIFDRGDYYSAHGEDAQFIANSVSEKTHT
jgi:hypothetical protein